MDLSFLDLLTEEVPHPAFFNVHREIYDEANSFLYSMILELSLENGGLVDAGGVPENQSRQLWLKLTRDSYKITREGIPLLKLQFYNQLAFRQTKDLKETSFDIPTQLL
jgi:hypothetical protein